MNINGKLTRSVTLSAQLWCEVPRKEQRLPEEYQEVEYLKGDGTAYLNIGFPFSDNSFNGINNIIEISSISEISERSTESSATFGLKNLNSYVLSSLVVPRYNDDGTVTIFVGTVLEYDIEPVIGEPVLTNVKYQRTSRYYVHGDVTYGDSSFGDKSYDYAAYNLETGISNDIYVFAQNNNDTAENYPFRFFSGKIYSVIFKYNSKEILNLVPCYRRYDSKPGMYDMISQTFFTNANSSGSFSVGGDV